MPAKSSTRKHQRPRPPRYPIVAMVTRPVYRMLRNAARAERISVSRLVSELLALGMPERER